MSDKTDYIVKKNNLTNKIKEWKDEYESFPEMIKNIEDRYRQLSDLKSHKFVEDLDSVEGEGEAVFPVEDYIMSEKSITAGWEQVFGVKCDIFAKIFYIHASKMQDYAKLDFMDFIDSIMPFYDSNVVKRNRQVFNILDIDKDGKIDIISMLQLYRYLPERCLLRYEILLMLDTYKAKNIIQKSASG